MKILIIRFSSIGDIVLTSPVLRCLKTQLPDAELHFLSKRSFLPILEANPYLTKVHHLDQEMGEIIPRLKAERFDLIIDLHHNLRSRKVKRKMGVPSKSFSKLNIQKWLRVNLNIDRLPPVHIVDRYLETVKHLGIKNDEKGLDYFIPSDKELCLDSLPASHRSGYVAIAIGAQHATKKMPREKIKSIAEKVPFPVVLIGGKEDQADGEFIAAGNQEKIWNACGSFDLHGSACLVKNARLVITHDTGMMHIAAAFQKKIISIWGNTIPEFGMYPYMPQHPEQNIQIENNHLRCRPCSKIGYAKCPKGHFKCMIEIPDEKILQAVESVLR
jgi:ADP-heptose:LPS heptosyltransferase